MELRSVYEFSPIAVQMRGWLRLEIKSLKCVHPLMSLAAKKTRDAKEEAFCQLLFCVCCVFLRPKSVIHRILARPSRSSSMIAVHSWGSRNP